MHRGVASCLGKGINDAILCQIRDQITARLRKIRLRAAHADLIGGTARDFGRHPPGFAENKDYVLTPKRSPTPARSCSARHQSSLARYHCTVRFSPSSTVTEGRQPSSVRMRVGSIA